MTDDELLKIPKGTVVLTEQQLRDLNDYIYAIKNFEQLLTEKGRFGDIAYHITKSFDNVSFYSSCFGTNSDVQQLVEDIQKIYFKFVEDKLQEFKKNMIEKHSVVIINEKVEKQNDYPF